jgi:Xaa-Pro aminopeptidase
MSKLRFVLVGFLLALSFTPLSVRAGEFQDDLKARRARAMERLAPEAMMILWSAPVRVYSRDVDYEFRQDSNLYYLTGIEQQETILVLMPGNKTRKEILFVRPGDPVREQWEGHRLTRQEATALSGVETVFMTTQFESFINGIFSRQGFGAPGGGAEYETFFKALDEGRAKLNLILDPQPALSQPVGPPLDFANRLRERFSGFLVQDASPIVRDLRQVKTPYERKILERSLDISSEAHMAGMKAARPGAYEYEVEAAIEYVYKVNGAYDWGYPSIVGSGPNATTLHYNESKRKMQAGDLLLVDAACNYQYMIGDITRTYPVSGTFTETQKEIYRIVLAAQEEAMNVARAGMRTRDVHQKTVEIVKQGLLKLGLITDTSGDQYRIWYMHGSVHFIGGDVHDVGNYGRPLEPGMAFVIEPGIYIREGALENLPKTPENVAFIEKVRPAYEKYKNIGVRVEDSFLLTETGLKRLSAKAPRTIEEIESFMRSRPAPASSPR